MSQKQRHSLHFAFIIGFMLVVVTAYPLAKIALGTNIGFLNSKHLGLLTSLQFFVGAALMLGAWLTTPNVCNQTKSINGLYWVLIAGIILRVILIPVDSYTSNDIDRYLWDGRVALQGYDPYQITPDDAQLVELRKHWPTPPEHSAYATVYPPLAIATFAVISSIGSDYAPILWKSITALSSIITLLVALLVLRHAQRLQHFALVALSPLLILETGVGAHLDTFTTLMVTLAIFAWQRKYFRWAGIAIGAGALFKLLPIFLILPMFFSLNANQHRKHLLAGAVLTLILGYGLPLLIGIQTIGVLPTFFEKWRFGSPIFNALNNLFNGYSLIIVIAVILSSAFILICYIAKHRPIQAFQFSLAAPLLLSPVVFPWYLMALVPLITLKPSVFLLTWVILIPGTYEVLGHFITNGNWAPASWPLWLIFSGSCLALFVDSMIKANKKSQAIITT